MFRLTAVALVAALLAVAPAPAADVPKFPDLKAKEWKKEDNGMKVWDVKEGKGDGLKKDGSVVAHYTLWLTDGTLVQSSKEGKGEPFDSPLANLIEGWKIGMPGMKAGGIRRFVIPPELAYGKRAKPGIPADSTLVFEIELIEAK